MDTTVRYKGHQSLDEPVKLLIEQFISTMDFHDIQDELS